MNEKPVFAHRDKAGYCFVSVGFDHQFEVKSHHTQQSGIERIEAKMHKQFGEDFWGPQMEQAEQMDEDELHEAAELPLESRRGDVLYQVGTVTLDDDNVIQDIYVFDEWEEVELLTFEPGQVFQTPSGPIQVESVGLYGDYLTVTDPTCHHPQDARSDTWSVETALMREDMRNGDVEQASLEVTLK